MTALMSLAMIILAGLAALIALAEPVMMIVIAIVAYLKTIMRGPLKERRSVDVADSTSTSMTRSKPVLASKPRRS